MTLHTLDDLRKRRMSEVAFLLAKLILEKYFRTDVAGGDADVKSWLFPQILSITKRWLADCLTCKDDTFPQLLLLVELAHDAADRIYRSIVETAGASAGLKPIPRAYEPEGGTRYVDFDTAKPVFETSPDKCHISHVVADTDSWEQKLAQALESMPEVVSYAKNQGLDFKIPYTLNGEERQYYPDFIAMIDVARLGLPNEGRPDILDDWSVEGPHRRYLPNALFKVVIEVSGENRKDKTAKVATARTQWVPAVNNHGGFGRWVFVEVTDPWDAKRTIRAALAAEVSRREAV